MKITEIEAIPINVPMKSEMVLRTSHGIHETSPYVIVRIHTDEGLTGLGEATVTPRWSGETSPGCVAIIRGLLAPALTGQDPCQINHLRRQIDSLIRLNPFTKAAVEMALWDLAGKAANVPVYQLLGGKVREEIPIRLVIGSTDVDEASSRAERFLEWGAKCLKVKVGINPEQDIERVRSVRQLAGPDIPISVDANCGWTVQQAKRTLPRLREFNILFAEQPIPTADISALADLRKHTDIPIMADESAFTCDDVWHLTSQRAVDIISVYPGKNGGIQNTVECVHAAKAGGLPCAMGSNLELGIGTAAMLHLGAALPSIASERYPGDFIGPLYHQSDLLKTPLQIGPVAAHVPTGPGLGVELDEAQLEKYRNESELAQGTGSVTDITFEG